MPRLILSVTGTPDQPFQLPVDRELTTIGRSAENDIVINSSSASTQHCILKRVTGGFTLEDLHSTNGLMVENQRIAIIPLTDGMTISIGDEATIQISFTEDELAVFSEEKLATQPPAPTKEQLLSQRVPAKSPLKTPQPYQPKQESSSTFLFLLLAIVALLGGIGFRHYQNISAPAEAPTQESKVAE